MVAIFAACLAGGWFSSDAMAQSPGAPGTGLLKTLSVKSKQPTSISTSANDRYQANGSANPMPTRTSEATASDPEPGTAPQMSMEDPAQNLMAEMERVQKQMDHAFEEAFRSMSAPRGFAPGVNSPGFGAGLMSPGMMNGSISGGLFQQGMGVRDDGDHYTVEVQVPETDAPNVNVKLEGQLLTISSSVDKSKKNTSATGAQMQSRQVSSFQQAVTIPGPVKSHDMKVDRQKDRVTITIPKA
jgi:HSP20 family molecular chaperone IbpA